MLTAFSPSRKNSAHARRFGDSTDGENVSARPHLGAEALGGRVDAGEGRAHRFFERVFDAILSPEVGVLILHPLVVTDGDASGVCENVWDEEDAAVEEYAIRSGRHRAVGKFADYRGAHALDVCERDAVLKGRGQKYVAANLENIEASDGGDVR